MVTRLIEEGRRSPEWEPAPNPTEFCVATMGMNGQFTHCGLYTEADGGLIIHCIKDHPVAAVKASRLKATGINAIKYFRHGALRRN